MRTALDLGFVLRSAALALPVTVASTAARVLIEREQLVPDLPGAVALAVGAGLLVAGGAGAWLWRREAAWLCCFALPVMTLGVHLPDEAAAADASFRILGIGWAWAASFDALALWLWLGGPRRPGVTFALFATATGLKAQLVGIGAQLILPGMLLSVALSMLEIAATRQRDGWRAEAFRAIPRAPGAWAVAVAAPFTAIGLGLATMAVVTLDPGVVWRQILDPMVLPTWARVVADVTSAATFGGLLAVAGALYDAVVGRGGPVRGSAGGPSDPADPWSVPQTD